MIRYEVMVRETVFRLTCKSYRILVLALRRWKPGRRLTFAIASRAGKYMLEESPEKRPATPIIATTVHFCRLEKT